MFSIKKVLCIIISVMILSSLCIMTAYASAEVGAGEVIVDNGGSGDSGDIGGGDSGDIGGDDSGDIGGGDSGDISGDDSGDISGDDSGDISGGNGDSGDVSGDDTGSDTGYVDNGSDTTSGSGTTDSSYIYNSGGYVTNSDSSYYYFDEEEAAKSGDPNISKVEGEAELYDTSSEVNSAALKENEWSDIKLDTTTTVTPAAGSFNSIKENTETEDNSQWILYIGIVLIGLSFLGILYFIVATSVYKKKLDELQNRQDKNNERRRNANYDLDEFNDIEDYSYKVNSDRKYTINTKKQSRQNTQEVRLPRRYVSRH